MNEKLTKKSKNVDYFHIPRPLWRRLRRLLPKPKPHPRGGRPPADNRAVMNGIWYVLWTGCQWKAIQRDWFGMCSSILHERFQEWQRSGIFLKLLLLMVRFYVRQRGIQWLFQAIDSKSCPAPLGGEASDKSPVDRGKRGSKVHVLVDQRGTPSSRGTRRGGVSCTGETQYPARRWVVERTLGWLTKRRSIRVRWCKKADNWLGFLQLACAHILMDMTVYG